MKKIILVGLLGMLVFSGCAAPRNNTQKGAAIGGVGGAVAGAVRGHAIGSGENRPVATNATAEGRQMNRRVEIGIQPIASG